MPRMPRATAAQVLRALHRAGGEDVRQSGGHLLLRHPTRPGRVTLSRHAGKTLKPKTLQDILDQAGLTADELRDLL